MANAENVQLGNDVKRLILLFVSNLCLLVGLIMLFLPWLSFLVCQVV